MEIQERSRKLLKILQSGMYEREDQIKLAFLSMVAGESLFLLGPPGTAKSLTARRLKFALAREGENVQEFEYLMGKFSTPEEIFGPISVRGLKEDRYERKTEGYLPTAHVVFLDEIWKAGPAIQNSLLTVVNEKLYRNGSQEQKIAMQALIAASNELPAEGMGLEALWDRFLLRLYTPNIADDELFLRMLSGTGDVYGNPFAALDAEDQNLCLKLEELEEWRKGASRVDLGEEVGGLILKLKARLQLYNEALENGTEDADSDEAPEKSKKVAENQKQSEAEPAKVRPFYVSDRRWKKIVGLLKTSAFLHGREQVDRLDFGLVMHCIWEDEAQIAVAKQLVAEILEAYGFRSEAAEQQLRSLEQELKQHLSEVQAEQSKGEINPKLQHFFVEEKQELAENIDALRQSLDQQKAEQKGQNLFASSALLQPLQKSFAKVEARLDVLEKGLKSGKLPEEKKKAEKKAKNVPKYRKPDSALQKRLQPNGTLANTNLSGLDLSGLDLTNANLIGANLAKSNLMGANLQNANLQGANLDSTNLESVNLTNTRGLEGVTLRNANLEGANLMRVNLSNVELVNANLTGVNLQNAILQNANLQNVNLNHAKFNQTYLQNAKLQNANLQHVYLGSTHLQGTIYNKNTKFPADFDPIRAGMQKA